MEQEDLEKVSVENARMELIKCANRIEEMYGVMLNSVHFKRHDVTFNLESAKISYTQKIMNEK